MPSAAASLAAREEPGSLVLTAGGEWLVEAAADLDRRLRLLPMPRDRRVRIDLSGVERLDTTGAWLLLRTERDLAARGNAVEMLNLRPSFAPLIDQVRTAASVSPA